MWTSFQNPWENAFFIYDLARKPKNMVETYVTFRKVWPYSFNIETKPSKHQ